MDGEADKKGTSEGQSGKGITSADCSISPQETEELVSMGNSHHMIICNVVKDRDNLRGLIALILLFLLKNKMTRIFIVQIVRD